MRRFDNENKDNSAQAAANLQCYLENRLRTSTVNRFFPAPVLPLPTTPSQLPQIPRAAPISRAPFEAKR